MHAYIITGAAEEWIKTLLTERSVAPHDTIAVSPDPTSIGIEMIRATISRLAIHPIAGKRHAVVIHHAHAMTPEAQNAFLKTLEEPPGEALIILETDQPDSLLPTVLSRCHTIRLPSPREHQQNEVLELLLASSVGERLKMIDSIGKTRDDALLFVDRAINALHNNLANGTGNPNLLRALLTARTQLLGNITPKLALDAAFLYNE